MWRIDLHFLVCCCRAFLPRKEQLDDENEDARNKESSDYYELLGVKKDASTEEIRRAYKKRSLQFHPDKIAQRRGAGNFDEEVSRREFQRIKEAYEVVMDPKKRDVYDIMGAEAMPYLLNPASIEFSTVYGNLARATAFDRLKVVFGYLLVIIFFLIQPILICLKVDDDGDGVFSQTSWSILFIPMWIQDFIAFLVLGIAFKMVKRENTLLSLIELQVLNFSLYMTAQIFLVLKFDSYISWPYAIVFIPIYIQEFVRVGYALWIIRKYNQEIAKMVTITFIEKETGKPYSDMSPEERDEINEKYIIVHTPPMPSDMDEALKELVDDLDIQESPEYQQAQKFSQKGMEGIGSAVIHCIFLGLIVPNLDNESVDWNWWIVFIPFWILFCLQCSSSCFVICCTANPAQEDVYDEIEEEDEDEGDFDHVGASMKDLEIADVEKVEETPEKSTEKDDNDVISTEDVLPEMQKGESSTEKEVEMTQAFSFNEKETYDKMKDVEKIFDDMDEEDAVSRNSEEEQPEYPGEEDSSSVEATARAISSCCLTLFYLTITCLFVGKLEGDEGSYSAFWVIFPILLPAGCLFCCMSAGIMMFRGFDAFSKTETSNESEEGEEQEEDEGEKIDVENPSVDKLSPMDIDHVDISQRSIVYGLKLTDTLPPPPPVENAESDLSELD